MTPFKDLLGPNPRTLLQFMDELFSNEEVANQLKKHNLILDELKNNLLKAQQQMNKYIDTSQWEVKLQVDDWVFFLSCSPTVSTP